MPRELSEAVRPAAGRDVVFGIRPEDIQDRALVADVLYAAQAGSPEVNSLVIVDTANQATIVSRNGTVLVNDWSDDSAGRDRLEEVSKTKQSFWGEVLWTQDLEIGRAHV